jgi:phosphoribosyl 1,2-cyclic phosphodiesterase
VRVTFWGTRGSLAAAGEATVRYGGDTPCVQILASDGTCLVLDAGSGIRRLGETLPASLGRLDVFLTHLHMDHIQGLGFFAPLFRPGIDTHIWGPPSTSLDLRHRLGRYLSPPLVPVRMRDLQSHVHLHDAPDAPVRIGGLEVTAAPVIHPGPTVGYRITEGQRSVVYLPDHEPALGWGTKPVGPDWTSGFELARDADLLIHDCQYFAEERAERLGWGHSSVEETAAFATLAGARRLACFHHDPAHDDDTVDRLVAGVAAAAPGLPVSGARQGETLEV